MTLWMSQAHFSRRELEAPDFDERAKWAEKVIVAELMKRGGVPPVIEWRVQRPHPYFPALPPRDEPWDPTAASFPADTESVYVVGAIVVDEEEEET